ncbi:MAG: DUF503 domain-containing protein [Candidatus Rokubacteria bacterium]|jgi:hypothetical protein|nr:DUF503 domain-containing protein [Candidatus Rokubacteria bacterium]
MSAIRVALGTVELHLPGVSSLKEKRHVLKGIKERVKNRFNVSIAEVDLNDTWQRATLGIACVSNDSRHADEQVAKAVNLIEELLDGSIIDYRVEVL